MSVRKPLQPTGVPGGQRLFTKTCLHPMKQVLSTGGEGDGSIWWWCPTCDDTWRDPDNRPTAAALRDDRVPRNGPGQGPQ